MLQRLAKVAQEGLQPGNPEYHIGIPFARLARDVFEIAMKARRKQPSQSARKNS
jgi:hypothetical protein